MSDHSVNVVRLDALDVASIVATALAVTDWLVAEGIVVANPDPGDPRQRSAWMPGPRCAAAFANPTGEYETRHFPTTVERGVDVGTERVVTDPGGNFEPARCPSCDASLAQDTYLSAFETWLESTEPAVTCDACGRTAPVGDWRAPFGLAVGAPTVTFNNWPLLSDAFLAEVCARLGGRTTVIYRHL